MAQGPNVRKLIARRMATLMIPPDTPDGEALATGIRALGRATQEVASWIEEVKRAPDNLWGDDDEAIAGFILSSLLLREAERKRRMGGG